MTRRMHKNLFRCLAVIFLSLVLAGCQVRPGLETRRQVGQDSYQAVHDVFVVSNRELAPEPGQDLSHIRSQRLKYGVYRVSVPRDHRTGRLEYASANRSRPDRHFEVVAKQVQNNPARLVASINQALEKRAARGLPRGVFLFVHGFNYTFPETVFQTAQLSFDTGDLLVPVSFAWPSRGTLSGYGYDRESIAYSRDDLTATLDLLGRTNAESIMILSHSMGAALTVESMRQLSLAGQRNTLGKIKNLTLASPDIATTLFLKQLGGIAPRPDQLVVLTSSDDRALGLSQSLARSQARIGSLADVSVLTRLGINVVDISEVVDRGLVNHSKFSKSPATISLLKLMMQMQRSGYDKPYFDRVLRSLVGKTETFGLNVFPAHSNTPR